jgi:Rhodopirellula transposase DDE domain
LDTNTYPTGRKVSDEEMATLSLQLDPFHGEWNYTILPRTLSRMISDKGGQSL